MDRELQLRILYESNPPQLGGGVYRKNSRSTAERDRIIVELNTRKRRPLTQKELADKFGLSETKVWLIIAKHRAENPDAH